MNNTKIKLFADGADESSIIRLAENTAISGFTTNPTLMHQAGISNYESFCRKILQKVPNKPFSFEVFADDFDNMERQAMKIAEWGENVYVKVPISNTKGESCGNLVEKLARQGMKLNITAIMTIDQVKRIIPRLEGSPASYISVFAGRIADTGVDPCPLMKECVGALVDNPNLQLIWASPREVLNIFQAENAGCHVITIPESLVRKLGLIGKNLEEFSLDTVQMFYEDGKKAGFYL